MSEEIEENQDFCDECCEKINKNEKYFLCFECYGYYICSKCRSLGKGHKHNNIDFLYELNEPHDSFILRNHEEKSMGITSLMMRCFKYYSNRHFVGTRSNTKENLKWYTYSDILEKIHHSVLGMRNLCDLKKGDLVLIQCSIRIEPIIIWFAGMFSGIGFVPLQSILSTDQKIYIILQTKAKAIFCLESECGEMVEIRKQCPSLIYIINIPNNTSSTHFEEKNILTFPSLLSFGKEEEKKLSEPLHPVTLHPKDIICVIFTSGTTSNPKGIVFREERWIVDYRFESEGLDRLLPVVIASVLPFSSVSGIYQVVLAFVLGGRIGLLTQSDFKNIFDDFKDIRPTIFVTVPRILKIVELEYQRRVQEMISSSSMMTLGIAEKIVKSKMKNVFGNRLFKILVGSAHCPETLKKFIENLTKLKVEDVYGLSEIGTVTSQFTVNEGLEVRIIDCPELGCFTTDKPYPRGELLVKNPYKARVEYLNVDEKTMDERFDKDGFFHTGDIVEKRLNDQIILIDRKNNIIKLSHGEFVSLEKIEMVLECSEFVDQIVIFPNPEKTALFGLVSFNGNLYNEVSEDEVLKDLILLSGHKELKPFEFPFSIRLVTEGFPLTETTKKNRKKIEKKYHGLLKEMFDRYRNTEENDRLYSTDNKNEKSKFSVFEFLRDIGISVDSDMMEMKLSELGVKSFTAIIIRSQIERICGIKINYSEVMKLTVSKINDFLDGKQENKEECEGEEEVLETGIFIDLQKEQMKFNKFIESLRKTHPNDNNNISSQVVLEKCITKPRTIFMTGSTGFLGRRTLEEIVISYPNSKVLCMVRSIPTDISHENVIFFEGDLSSPLFGKKSQQEFDDFFHSYDIDLIFHCGALVNHFADYEHHYETNVGSLYRLLKITNNIFKTPIVYISTISVHEEYGVEILDQKIPCSGGYEGSKWVTDCLLQSLSNKTKNVLVIRPNYILVSRGKVSTT